jgi:hypothetical protein
MKASWLAIFLAGSILSLSAVAAESHSGAESHATGDAKPSPGAVVSNHADWAPSVVSAILALFAAAAFVGPIYRLNMPEEPQVEDFHSHDEPPGTSHHHGAGGTIDHSAPEKPHHH